MSEFKKVLGWLDATAMVAGIIIGTGIFLTASDVANQVDSPFWFLMVWLVGGIISAMGALTVAQLAVLYPQSGGIYIYLREAFGGGVAFVYGCALFVVLQCGSIAAIAVGFGVYFGELIPWFSMQNILIDTNIMGYSWNLPAGRLAAVFAIILFTAINCRGARAGGVIQTFLTLIKVATLLVFVVLALSVTETKTVVNESVSNISVTNFALALVPVMWAFAGWFSINFAAEEVENPKRNIPLALLVGIGSVTVLYLLVNYVYVTSLPMKEIKKTTRIAYSVMDHLFGSGYAQIVAAAIVVSALGALNGMIFTGPRAYFAMARDGLFPGFAAQLHPRYETPYNFLVLQGIWSCLLALSGGYNDLFTYVMFSGFLFTALTGAALIVLYRRNREPLLCAWSYPYIPILFILSSLALAAYIGYHSYIQSAIGLGVLVLSGGLYFFIKRR